MNDNNNNNNRVRTIKGKEVLPEEPRPVVNKFGTNVATVYGYQTISSLAIHMACRKYGGRRYGGRQR